VGRHLMDHGFRSLTPITDAAWAALDAEVH
jgi:hypothetical protein